MSKLLIVVDYQIDFVSGALGFEQAQLLEEGICAKIHACRQDGWEICFTLDTHTPAYLSTQEGQRLPVEHCIAGTDGWNLYGRVAQMTAPEDKQFEKNTFGSYDLAAYLRQGAYEEIVLVGLVSNICVISNAILAKAALPEARIVVDGALTASFDPVLHGKALDVMEGLQIEITNRSKDTGKE